MPIHDLVVCITLLSYQMLNLSLAETKRDFRGMRPREHSMVYVYRDP
jgi:hypothetical protein